MAFRFKYKNSNKQLNIKQLNYLTDMLSCSGLHLPMYLRLGKDLFLEVIQLIKARRFILKQQKKKNQRKQNKLFQHYQCFQMAVAKFEEKC